MRKLIFFIIVSLLFASGLLAQPEQFNFKIGDCAYNGKVKSVSIYEYEQLATDSSPKSELSTIEVPSKYFEYNIDGKMVTQLISHPNDMLAIKKIYDDKGNIKYEIKTRLSSSTNKKAFREKLISWNDNLASQSDSLAEFAWKKNNNLSITVYHYDYTNALVIRMPYQFAPPTHFKVDKKGNIINEQRFRYQYGVLETLEFEREYLADKILLEKITNDAKVIFKRYLYDSTTGNISNLIMSTEDGLLIRQEIYTYSDDTDSVMIYDSNNILTKEIIKKKKLDSTISTHFKVDSLGEPDKSSEIIEYKDEFENVIKRYTFNSLNSMVKISEFHYEYY